MFVRHAPVFRLRFDAVILLANRIHQDFLCLHPYSLSQPTLTAVIVLRCILASGTSNVRIESVTQRMLFTLRCIVRLDRAQLQLDKTSYPAI